VRARVAVRGRLGKRQGLLKIICKGKQFCVENVCSYDPEAGYFTSYNPCFLTLAVVHLSSGAVNKKRKGKK
jgi:hypothetical protein